VIKGAQVLEGGSVTELILILKLMTYLDEPRVSRFSVKDRGSLFPQHLYLIPNTLQPEKRNFYSILALVTTK
jgi:hypothetical protein